ncbi:hypothetical protein Peur_029347 [Populus x canadensis]
MVDNKDIKTRINEYHRLLENMKIENINLLEGFIVGILNKNYLTHGRNHNPPKSKVNLVEGEDIIAAVFSQVNMVTNEKHWVVNSSATRHMCENKEFFSTYTSFKDGSDLHWRLKNCKCSWKRQSPSEIDFGQNSGFE